MLPSILSVGVYYEDVGGGGGWAVRVWGADVCVIGAWVDVVGG